MTDYDDELRALDARLRVADRVRPGERVLDLGCGAGQTTRAAGRAVGPDGFALGVDISAGLLAQARERTAADGLANVRYEEGDAQVHPFPDAAFDVAISRFGVMFFADPGAAFANVARALRPGGRLVLLVWQPRERNAWATELDRALGALPDDDPYTTFSLGDPEDTARLLAGAGFTDVAFEDVRAPVYYGPLDAAFAFVRRFSSTQATLARLAPPEAEQALARLRATLAAHERGAEGVVFDASAWIVTARALGFSSGQRTGGDER